MKKEFGFGFLPDWARDCTIEKGSGKWWVFTDKDGVQTLVSYFTPIMRRYEDGTIVRFVESCSMTTFQHIRKWSGLRADDFRALPLTSIENG